MRGIVWTAASLAAALTVALPAKALEHRYIGEVYATPTNYCADGSLPADGRILPFAQYQALASILDNRYGGDGRKTIGLPKIAAEDFGGTGKPVRWCVVHDGEYPVRAEHE